MEQFPSKNPNPVLRAGRNGRIIYANRASDPLLREWGIEVGEKLPSSIGSVVREVIHRNRPGTETNT